MITTLYMNEDKKERRTTVIVNNTQKDEENKWNYIPNLGEIYYADLGECDKKSHKQGGKRPVIIAQKRKVCASNDQIWVIPITSQIKATYLPVHVSIPKDSMNNLSKDSMVVVEQIVKIPKNCLLGRKVGTINNRTMKDIAEAIKCQFPF